MVSCQWWCVAAESGPGEDVVPDELSRPLWTNLWWKSCEEQIEKVSFEGSDKSSFQGPTTTRAL